MKKLPIQFYQRIDVLLIAKQLIGKIIVTNFNGFITSGRIVETEAYVAHIDKLLMRSGANELQETNICMLPPELLMYTFVTVCIKCLMLLQMIKKFLMRS